MTVWFVLLSFLLSAAAVPCRLTNSTSIPIGLMLSGYTTSPEAGIEVAFFDDDLCTVIVPLRPGYAMLLSGATGSNSLVSTGEFQTAYELPAWVDAGGSIWFATSSTSSGSGVCAYCSFKLVVNGTASATTSSVRGWSASSVCNRGFGQIWRSSYAFALPLTQSFAVINVYSLTVGSTIAGIRVLNGTTGVALNGTLPAAEVEPLALLRAAPLPSAVTGLFLVGSYYSNWTVATVTADARVQIVATLPNSTLLQQRGLSIVRLSSEPRIFCQNNTKLVALGALDSYAGPPRWSLELAPESCYNVALASTPSGDIVLSTPSVAMLIDGATGYVVARDARGAAASVVRVLPRTGHIVLRNVKLNSSTKRWSASCVVFDDQLQFVRNTSLSPAELDVISNVSNVQSIDMVVNPFTGDKFVTLSAYPNLADNRLFAWSCNATDDAAACAPPPPPITRFRPTTLATTTTTMTATPTLTSTTTTSSVITVASTTALGTDESRDVTHGSSNSDASFTDATSGVVSDSESRHIANSTVNHAPSSLPDDDIWAPPNGIGFMIACGIGGAVAVLLLVLAGWFLCRRKPAQRHHGENHTALLADHDHE